MSRELLQNIIEDFNPEKFVRFFREKNRTFAPRKEDLIQYDDDNFRNGTRLGEIQFSQDEKMLICAFVASQPLSERSGKKAQYEKGKKILKDSQSDAGIFIFYDTQGNFRFSLIYANYLGKKRDWSIFRRFTYYVSREYTNKTFLRQIGEEDFSSLEKIKNAFSVEKVTKSFYTDIANWYFWAIQKTEFPTEAEKEENGRNVAVIRLITRLIFIWFMKVKGLIQQDLFNYNNISTLLKDLSSKNTTYYKAILQNLFFATLNTKIEDRKFRFGKSFQGKNKDYMDHGIYRYEDYFKNKEDMLEIFKDIPFLNGGLFDCLDRRITENQRNIEMRIDGFTDKDVGLKVPNVLFFSDEINVDLNKEYGTKNKNYKVRGLVDILSSYNFTIDENDPNDADVALDPELLGKVFENLLASFNPETATTARKATGSYYTPREIVNYMVDESLTAYLSNVINSEADIRNLISFTDKPHQFTDTEADTLIRSIDNVKILDPAVGSGAFPMGMLHKLVYILGRLDPDNSKWRELQRQKAIKDTEEAYKIGDKEERQKRLLDINEVFDDNASDYGRKLYLIENCIYGVDIQPIAVQIAKLRFFISLLVDQGINPKKENLGIRPLPNLETKFVAANTLIGIERPAQGLLRNREIDRKEAELKQVRERHFTARTPKSKQKCIEDDKKLRAEISDMLKKDGFPSGTTEKLTNWNPYDQNASAEFFDPEWMFGINSPSPLAPVLRSSPATEDGGKGSGEGGFDIVIANPPYIFTRDADFSHDFKTYIAKRYFSLLTTKTLKSKANQSGKINLFALFILRGLSDCKEKGILTYILPNNLLRTTTYDLIRKYILDNSRVEEIVDLGSGVFDNVTASTIIFRLSNNKKNSNHRTSIVTNINDLEKHEFVSFDIEQNQFLKNVSYVFNLFADASINDLLTKISKNKNELGLYCIDIIAGIDAPKHLISESPSKNTMPLIEGKTIKRYSLNKINKYITWNKEEIHRTRPDYLWKAPKKIIIQRISGGSNPLTATIDANRHKTFASVNNLLLKEEYKNHYEFILALLNSKVINWFYANSFSNNSELTVNISKTFLEKLPIPDVSPEKQKPIIELVDQILTAKKKDPNADTSALERQIDEMVYELYGLTSDEIKIVEGA